MSTLRMWVLRAARGFGLFALARRLTAGKLRILAYHGASIADEHRFRPGLFMTEQTFRGRLRILANRGYPVLSLGAALERLREGTLPPCATVITIDDGWIGTYRSMGPALEEYGFPATLYLATYYIGKQTQVFNVAVGYVLWRARQGVVDLAAVAPGLSGRFALATAAGRDEVETILTRHGDGAGSANARQELLRGLCRALGMDCRDLETSRQLSFMSGTEARQLMQKGIDLQLHTHRHRFPTGSVELARREIDDNRAVLNGMAPGPFTHFCYPSGRYEPRQIPWLQQFGVTSAVTTNPGLNDREASSWELRRILDSEVKSEIEFEAELCGLGELVRRLRRGLTGRNGRDY